MRGGVRCNRKGAGVMSQYGGPGGREQTLYTCGFHACGFVV